MPKVATRRAVAKSPTTRRDVKPSKLDEPVPYVPTVPSVGAQLREILELGSETDDEQLLREVRSVRRHVDRERAKGKLDALDLMALVTALTGADYITTIPNPVGFADSVLRTFGVELVLLRGALGADDCDTKNASVAVYNMEQRLTLMLDVLERLRKIDVAREKGAA